MPKNVGYWTPTIAFESLRTHFHEPHFRVVRDRSRLLGQRNARLGGYCSGGRRWVGLFIELSVDTCP